MTNIASKDAFPVWKKSLIEGGRVFIMSFAAVIFTFFQSGVDLRQWETWLNTLLISATVAGAKAVFKLIREKLGNGDYSSIWYKITL